MEWTVERQGLLLVLPVKWETFWGQGREEKVDREGPKVGGQPMPNASVMRTADCFAVNVSSPALWSKCNPRKF